MVAAKRTLAMVLALLWMTHCDLEQSDETFEPFHPCTVYLPARVQLLGNSCDRSIGGDHCYVSRADTQSECHGQPGDCTVYEIRIDDPAQRCTLRVKNSRNSNVVTSALPAEYDLVPKNCPVDSEYYAEVEGPLVISAECPD